MANKRHREVTLRQKALERENLRLQRKIATLEAKLISARNELLLRPPYSEPRQELSVESLNRALEKLSAKNPARGRNGA
jgi:hypothetical protein